MNIDGYELDKLFIINGLYIMLKIKIDVNWENYRLNWEYEIIINIYILR